MQANTLELLEQLISKASITPDDAGCQQLLSAHLTPLGFTCTQLPFGDETETVQNLWATHQPSDNGQPLVVFAGHTDVVPTGPEDQWLAPPFVPTHQDNKLYGRGTSDMKASLAAMVVATEAFLREVENPAINVAYLITSDEEGPAKHGTTKVCQWLEEQDIRLQYCIVGEPTAVHQTGDMIKNGRRGSLSGKLRILGKQGHIAYPQLALNPIHSFAPALQALVSHQWDNGNEYFPATSWQISNIHAGTGANNVIPGHLDIDFNFRFSSECTPEFLQQTTEEILNNTLGAEAYQLDWHLSGLPFLTPKGTLVSAAQKAISAVTGISTEISTSGGTSDGRFIAHICDEVIELGPPNASIHQINEHIKLSDLEPLPAIYYELLMQLHQHHS